MNRCTHGGQSDPGRCRPHNEDRWLADPTLGLYLVADGVGGHGSGALAARLVVESLPPLLHRHLRGVRDLADPRALERIREALLGANTAIRMESCQHRSRLGMGAAVVLAMIWDWQALIVHLGDSRAYRLHEGALARITRDHSVIQRLLDQGEITPEQADRHPDGHLLTHYVGLTESVEPGSSLLNLEPKDRILLCSDGLPAMLSDAEIEGIMSLPLPPPEICRLLVDAANLQGGEDNITVVVAEAPAAETKRRRPGG